MSELIDQLARSGTDRTPRYGRRSRRLLAVLITVVTVAMSAVAFQSPAQAYVGTSVLRNWETGRCLDSNWNGDVYTLPCSLPVRSNDHQIWEPVKLVHNKFDIVKLRNKATGLCLIWLPGNPNVIRTTDQCGYNGLASDIRISWAAEGTGWSNVVFRNRVGGQVLDGNHVGHVYPHASNNGGFQQWKFGY
ncbi:RICIN domain-containing protein [Dactylosporangium sp. CA-152071]|uniref:RICIN domain-containing protein n=1 Tax=Dactylosporangium sp. CA-152071 TaxID=3239933 RepID=UPI003D9009A8